MRHRYILLLGLFAARLAAQSGSTAGCYTELFKDLYGSPYSRVPDRAKYPRLRAAGRTRKIIDAGLEPCASRGLYGVFKPTALTEKKIGYRINQTYICPPTMGPKTTIIQRCIINSNNSGPGWHIKKTHNFCKQ
jgi:hypothetical protein